MKEKGISPFDFINSISYNKKDILSDNEEENLKVYNSFIINRGLSYFHDTILFANEMNQYHWLDKKSQYKFYLNSIPKKKRFQKWGKKNLDTKLIDIVKRYYDISSIRAIEYIKILDDNAIKALQNKDKKSHGGKRK